jgi:hypothetical protein
MIGLLLLPFRLGFGIGRVSAKVGWRTTKLLGFRRVALIGTGIAVGLLVAPVPGRELRGHLRRWLEAARVSDPELGERVRFELAHHPRTWHLPQPEVSVAARRVTLQGPVPDESSRQELVRATAALPGVAAVDDLLQVTGTPAAV